ncbi:unnamed protein product [Brugia timori]|uniref:Secreted protein n=1 Tax=Brugia timori TaxID=42155 RepID=A0A0R3QW77_9BILA|nr:unnamed protein product [Brugia timori]
MPYFFYSSGIVASCNFTFSVVKGTVIVSSTKSSLSVFNKSKPPLNCKRSSASSANFFVQILRIWTKSAIIFLRFSLTSFVALPRSILSSSSNLADVVFKFFLIILIVSSGNLTDRRGLHLNCISRSSGFLYSSLPWKV